MKLKHPWWDFLIIIALTGFGIIGIQKKGFFPPLWWGMAVGGGGGLILWVINQSREDSQEMLDQLKDPAPPASEEELARGEK